jgi:hypothetical protein
MQLAVTDLDLIAEIRRVITSSIRGSHSGGHEEFYLLCSPLKVNQRFAGTCHLIFRFEE